MIIEEWIQEAKEAYPSLVLKEIMHRYTYKNKYKRMEQAINRFQICSEKKEWSQIKKEMNLCKSFWGCYPLHYFRYDLYKKDMQLTEEELLNYVPEFFFFVLYLPFYDSREYEVILNDKNVAEQYLRGLDIPQPETVCKIIHNRIYNNSYKEQSCKEICRQLDRKGYEKIFMKPSDGEGGYGIYIFHRNAKGEFETKDGQKFHESFLNKMGAQNSYLIQAGLEQAEEISEIYPYAVNTLRICTENRQGQVRILLAILRMGRGGCEVDNSCQDGIFVKVNTVTGGMDNFAQSEMDEKFYSHPDTHFSFMGSRVPRWEKIKEFVIKSAAKMPQYTYLGWDIALGKEGPLVIEVNLGFGIDICQLTHGGIKGILGIEDPGFYWKTRGKR